MDSETTRNRMSCRDGCVRFADSSELRGKDFDRSRRVERCGGARAGSQSDPIERRQRMTAIPSLLEAMMRAGRLLRTCAVTIALVGLAGCAQTGNQGTAASAPMASTMTSAPPTSAATDISATVMLPIRNFAFSVPASVTPGARIMVMNGDSSAHTVTADAGGAFNVVVQGNGTAFFTAPATPGRYPFHCAYHSNMHGVLVVKSAP